MDMKNRSLWAPWRIKYVKSEKDGKCFLCERQKKGSSDEWLVVSRYKYCFVILNKYPYNSGHLMIAPYRHIDDIVDLKAEERREIFNAVIDAKKTLQKLMQPEGFNTGFNLGSTAGAGLKDHIHFHMVPRWIGDTNFMPVIGNTRVVPEALEKTAELIRKNWIK